MKIEINDKQVTVDGRVYELKVDYEKQMCGRREIGEMLGYRHSNGKVNLSNLYRGAKNAVYMFPNFEIDKADGDAKPWTRAQIREWLAIPLWERKKMYEETKDVDEQN